MSLMEATRDLVTRKKNKTGRNVVALRTELRWTEEQSQFLWSDKRRVWDQSVYYDPATHICTCPECRARGPRERMCVAGHVWYENGRHRDVARSGAAIRGFAKKYLGLTTAEIDQLASSNPREAQSYLKELINTA